MSDIAMIVDFSECFTDVSDSFSGSGSDSESRSDDEDSQLSTQDSKISCACRVQLFGVVRNRFCWRCLT